VAGDLTVSRTAGGRLRSGTVYPIVCSLTLVMGLVMGACGRSRYVETGKVETSAESGRSETSVGQDGTANEGVVVARANGRSASTQLSPVPLPRGLETPEATNAVEPVGSLELLSALWRTFFPAEWLSRIQDVLVEDRSAEVVGDFAADPGDVEPAQTVCLALLSVGSPYLKRVKVIDQRGLVLGTCESD